ncbi:MAG: NAD-dependent epimerase/dehydratase family protein [Candidatus Fermentibacteraceae bacterium]
MKCLVTGGTGFVGSNLALHLQSLGHEVLITGNESEQSIPEFRGVRLYPGLFGIDLDRMGRIDILFHQAAINSTRMTDRGEMLRANLEAPLELFRHVIGQGCRRIVYASTTAVYGRNTAPFREDGPLDLNTPYAESKKLLEDASMALGRECPGVVTVGLRYCNVYGPRENHKGSRATMIQQFARQMLTGNPRLFENGEQRRDYIYVKDVVRANELAAKAEKSCVVNCGSGRATTFNELVSILNGVLSLDRVPEYIPNPYEGSYQDDTTCDMSLAAELLGFVPSFGIADGIRDYHSEGWLTAAR